MATDDDRQTLARVLDWYRAMGVETATADSPVNWFERGGRAPGQGFSLDRADERAEPAPPRARTELMPKTPSAEPRPAPPRQFPTQAPDAAELEARTMARRAASLDELEAALRVFDGCGLKATARNLCFYRGAPEARVMIIGEAPGRDEDIEGKPFVGRAGKLLDKMLASIGLTESDVHITNIVYWRPPGNRTPTPQEAQVCRPFLDRQIELVRPEIIVLLGGAAAKHMLNVAEGIMRIRGRWRDIPGPDGPIRAIATLHPAYLLRAPAAKRLAWRDLQAVAAALAPGAGKDAPA